MKSFRLGLVLIFAVAISFLAIACSEDCPVCEQAPPPQDDQPPPGTDVGNVCSQDLCLNDAGKAAECQTFLNVCLANEEGINQEECVAGAWFFYCRDGI